MLNRKKITTDLCVVGGGMAGICAAISAARSGISVVLMHERPVLGGNASSEVRMWICGAQGDNNRETGIIEEIQLENLYRNPTKNYYIWDTVLYDFITREKNITLLLNCTCMDAEVSSGDFEYGREYLINKIVGYQMTTQTFFDVYADNYSDCSGDSILAPLTGAKYRIGRESRKEFGEETHVMEHDSYTMGNSCLLQGRETERAVNFIPPSWSTKLTAENFCNRNINVRDTSNNFWYLELGGNRDTIHEAEDINKELLSLALGTWDFIKNSGEVDADNWELEFIGFVPAKRESRRMVGEYIITSSDILQNKMFEDTVAYGGWPIDDHFPDGFYHKGIPNTNIIPPQPYCIPYRCLYSKNVSNLFFAGRNISMTHMAMSSIRVMATCAVMGQAVGYAAAIAKQHNLTPHGVYENQLKLLQKTLTDNDCLIPGVLRNVSDLCRKTPIINGNDYMKNGEDRPNGIYKNKPCGQAVKNGIELVYKFEIPQFVSKIHITFDSDLNRDTLSGDYYERKHGTRCTTLLNSPQTYVPKTLCKEFVLKIETENGTKIICEETCNLQRAYHLAIEEMVTSITLVPASNWGNSEYTNVFSFDFE